MDFIFTQRDLYWLDHLLPDESRRKKEDEAKAIESQRLQQVRVTSPSHQCTHTLKSNGRSFSSRNNSRLKEIWCQHRVKFRIEQTRSFSGLKAIRGV
jgi:hypothetical protein